MSDVIYGILAASSYTYTIALVLTLWAAIIVRTMSDSTTLCLLVSPFIYFGSLSGVYACRMLEIVLSTDRDANIIATSGLGICAGLLIVLLIGRAAASMAGIKKTGLEHRIDPSIIEGGATPRLPFSR